MEGIGIIWDMDIYNFDQKIKEIQDYKKEFGDFNIPTNYKPNPTLGNYVYRIKTKGTKEKWKIQKLHKIGFFEIGTKTKKDKGGHITQNWFNNLNELKKLEDPDIKKDNIKHTKLAKWLHNQKRTYRYGRLKDEQINELEKLNIKLPGRSKKRKKWEEYIEIIELFREEYGTKEITPEFDKEIYIWVNQQKINLRTKALKFEKVEKLKELGITETE